MKIKMYSLPNCKDCNKAKEYFDSKNVSYENIDMSVGGNKETIEMKKEFKKMGFKAYPIIIIQREGEDEMIFPGFDESVINSLLKEK